MKFEILFISNLNYENKERDWRPCEDLETYSIPGYIFRHSLRINKITLGNRAIQGEVNVVEVETCGYDSSYTIPIAVLKGGTEEVTANVNLYFRNSPVKFRLIQGNGPICIVGNHGCVGEILHEDELSEEDFSESSESSPG